MGTPRTPRILPGLFAGVLPLLLSPFSLALFVLQHGGWDRATFLLGFMARPWGLYFWISTACALGLAAALYSLASGREVPLLLPVTLSLVPWLVGIGLALYHAREAMAFVAQVDPPDQLTVLVRGTGDLLWMLLLGTWASTTLLLACVGGLIVTGVGGLTASEESRASALIRRMLEALVLLMMAGVGLTHISEDRGLAQVMEALSTIDPAEMGAQLDQAARDLSGIASLRPWALGALALGVGALGAYQLTRRPRAPAGLAALGTIALLVAGTFWADSRPLPRMERRIEAVLRPQLAPEGLRLLPFGGSWPANEVDIAVTAHELTGPDGSRLAWSAGERSLIDFLLNAYAVVEHRPARLMRKQSALIKDTWRTLTLALDERMTTPQLRRLLTASSSADLHRLILLTQRPLGSQADVSGQLRAVVSHHPFLRRLGALMDARPGAVEVYLPQAFKHGQGTRYTPPPSLWVGEVGAEREVRLSPWPPRQGQEEVVLALPGPEEAGEPLSGHVPYLYLHVREEAALINVAHAIRQARVHRFLVVLTVTPPPGEFPEP